MDGAIDRWPRADDRTRAGGLDGGKNVGRAGGEDWGKRKSKNRSASTAAGIRIVKSM
jgi:hypothetical protein